MNRTRTLKFVTIVTILFISIVLPYKDLQAINQTNTNATQIIGQPDYTTNLALRKGMWYPISIAQAGNKIFIAEGGPCRVSVYNNALTTSFQAIDYVVGQPNRDIDCDSFGIPTASRISGTRSVTSTGSKLIIFDTGNNRVLIWNTIPTTNDIPADVVLGQPNFTSNTANNGGISASSIYTWDVGTNPGNGRGMIYTDGTKLFVADGKNHRVLIWNTIPTTNNTPADVVVGQPNFASNTANNGGISARTLNNPRGIRVINGKLYICDSTNNRILVYNSIPTSNNAAADLVLGQSAFNTATVNNGGLSASSLNGPHEITESGGKVYVADYSNNRILIYNSVPDENFEAANVVLGQPNMTSGTANNGGVSSHSLYAPTMAMVINSKLYVVDQGNSRILVYSTLPTTNNADADIVLGQYSFTNNIVKDAGYNAFSAPEHDITDDGKLIVSDSTHNRVLIWNSIPTSNFPLNPNVVIGQPDLQAITANTGGLSGKTLSFPRTPQVCGNKLVVPDYSNNRVLIWNSIPASDFTSADIVLGQPDFISNAQNNGGRSAKSLRMPTHVACTNSKLIVDDLWNHRILIWNTFPTGNFEDADVVVGQPDFISGTANNGGVSNKSLNMPQGVGTDGTRLFVADTPNNRVLIWNTIPTTNFKEADIVIGQPDFTSNTVNNGGISASSLYSPTGNITIDDGRVIISDRLNNRVLGWNTIPTSNYVSADFVIGQSDFVSNVREVSDNRTNFPSGSDIYDGKIYIADGGNGRITAYAYGAEGDIEAPSIVSDEEVTIQLEAEGAKQMKVWEEGNESSAVWETYSTTKSLILSQGDGTKKIKVRYKDYANYEGQVLSANTVLDTTGPTGTISIISPNGNGYTNSATVSLRLNGVDTVSGVKKMMISSTSSFTGAAWENYNTSKVYTLTSGDGLKTVYVKYKDAAGNVSSSYGASITLDTTSSELVITKIGDTEFNENTQEYTVTTSTPTITGTGEAGSTVTIENGEDLLGTTLVDETGTWSFTSENKLEKGTYNLTLTVEDKAGNKEVKGLVMIVNITEDKPPVDDTDNNTGNPSDNNQDDKDNSKDKKEFNAALYCYLPLLLVLIILGIMYWYKQKRKGE